MKLFRVSFIIEPEKLGYRNSGFNSMGVELKSWEYRLFLIYKYLCKWVFKNVSLLGCIYSSIQIGGIKNGGS